MDQPIAADGGMLGICAQPTMRPPTLAPRASGRAGASGHSVAGRPRFGTADAGASESVDVAAYSVVAAWLANPAKHAQASEVTVCTHGGRMSKLVFLSCRFARRSPIAVGAHGVLRLLTCAEAIRLASCGAFRIVAVPPRWVLSKRWFGRAWRCPVGKGAVSPGQGPLVRVEVVHESERTRVTRLFLSVGTVIRKEPLGPDAQRRLRHETGSPLQRLRGVSGVAQVLDEPRYPGSIVLADAGGTSLASLAKPLAVDELIGLAVELAGAVAQMHRRGVMHRDITPANIVISGDGSPCLVDFALATSFAEVRPEFTHHTQIVGTLAYLAPEQTGRTGRSVDQRADLYALGATLYELATGSPPFGTGDPLRLTHDHLARVPVPPAEVNRAVPKPLSDIIMHLLEKEPDNRYQTADGVLYDLHRLRNAPTGALRIGERDVPLRLRPSRLVGREDEVAALQATFAEALAGRCRAVLVGGAPGVGKTALVDELRPVVTGSDGWFVAGKFDQYRRDLEFDGVYQAFRTLGRLLLAEPEDELAEVRRRIVDAVGANAGLLTATVPEFAALLGVAARPGGSTHRAGARTAQRRGGVAGGRLTETAGGVLRRRSAVGRAHTRWARRLGAGRGAGRGPVAGRRVSRQRGRCGASTGRAAVAVAGSGRRAAPAAGQPARAEPRDHGGRDAARGPGRGGESGRGDRAAYLRQSVRDGGVAQRAAPRWHVGRDGGRVAVGRGGGARSLGPLRRRRAVGGAG